MIKNSKQKFKYLEKEEKCFGEIKSILYHFKKAINQASKQSRQIFLEGESPTLKAVN